MVYKVMPAKIAKKMSIRNHPDISDLCRPLVIEEEGDVPAQKRTDRVLGKLISPHIPTDQIAMDT
jgi:hypothetical protein